MEEPKGAAASVCKSTAAILILEIFYMKKARK
jgi:hypothetical protein